MPQTPEDMSPDLSLGEYTSEHCLRGPSGLSNADLRCRERAEALAAEVKALVERGEAIGRGEMGRVWGMIEGGREG